MAERIARAQWTNLAKTFTEFFDGLGVVNADKELLSFHSHSHHVQTGFSIHSNGLVNASMPLHGLQSKFEVDWSTHPCRFMVCNRSSKNLSFILPVISSFVTLKHQPTPTKYPMSCSQTGGNAHETR